MRNNFVGSQRETEELISPSQIDGRLSSHAVASARSAQLQSIGSPNQISGAARRSSLEVEASMRSSESSIALLLIALT